MEHGTSRVVEAEATMEERLGTFEQRMDEQEQLKVDAALSTSTERRMGQNDGLDEQEERIKQLERIQGKVERGLAKLVTAVSSSTEKNDGEETPSSSSTSSSIACAAKVVSPTPTSPSGIPIPFLTSVQRTSLGKELLKAAKGGDLHYVRRLLDEGADVSYCEFGKTPLHWATLQDRLDILSLLLERGADVNARDDVGETALHWAASKDFSVSSIQLLIANGADVNSETFVGLTPLHMAVESDNTQSVLALIAAGARNNIKNYSGKKPSDYATDETVREILLATN